METLQQITSVGMPCRYHHELLRDVWLDPRHVHQEGEHGLLHHGLDHLVPRQEVLLDGLVLAQQRLLAAQALHEAERGAVHAGQGGQRGPHVGQLARPLVHLEHGNSFTKF